MLTKHLPKVGFSGKVWSSSYYTPIGTRERLVARVIRGSGHLSRVGSGKGDPRD